ncbi:transcriptional regulator, LytR family [Renibacterium salmoninarum ATCC 33209]|uniref:Transcriptional regulator, LytR family n=1 Tax=Renibacterium salmoninarum (strain ATCC 33209 / DSM 20767 / JCM 11484 / NBRC 15589 / NCIMB 2235) TaxID=288705 RepID=A9WQS2_RENSM|nr:transcriptional regulator, LytR family [Renibacterium salmoninarum ATCC 33209]
MSRRRADGGNGPSIKRPSDRAREDPDLNPRHLRSRRSAPLWLKLSAALVSVVLVAGIGIGAVLFLKLQGNVKVQDLNAGLDGTTAPIADDNHDAIQVLIMGTDTRSGKDASYGSEQDSAGYGNSDVMMLMNISADRQRVSMVSFPRDLMVPFPGCKDPKTGKVFAAEPVIQLNSALSMAGPGCTVETINKFTRLTIDHFMMADFNAVKELTTALGGVDVCVSLPVVDPASGLNLPAGTSSIAGDQALAFLRTRHAFGDASDLARIKAQQAFLASMSRKIKAEGTLTNLPKLYQIADIVTSNLTVDPGLASPASLLTMAGRLKDVDLSKIAFVTVPTASYIPDPGRVALKQPEASQLFSALRSDADLTATPTPSAPVTSAPPVAPVTPNYNKAYQPITVSNASGLVTRSQEILQSLVSDGYTKSLISNSVAVQPATQILYGSNFADVAQDIAAKYGIPASNLVSAPALGGVQIVIGQDFSSGLTFGNTPLPTDVPIQTAQQPTVCQQVNDLPR